MRALLNFLLVLALIVAKGCSRAVPPCNEMIFYHMPCYYPTASIPAAQKLMYIQYIHPGQGRMRARSDGISAFVAADSIGAGVGTFVKGTADQQQQQQQQQTYNSGSSQAENVVPSVGVQGVVSIAEAYPTQNSITNRRTEDQLTGNILPDLPEYDEVNSISKDEYDSTEQTFKDFNEDTTHSDEFTEHPIAHETTVAPALSSSPLPTIAATYIPPRKKIRVELEPPSIEGSDEHVIEPINSSRPKAARPPPSTRAPQQHIPVPAGTFFPINFGGASGGAIAIANSFSTGEGGTATSHATAYGTPKKQAI